MKELEEPILGATSSTSKLSEVIRVDFERLIEQQDIKSNKCGLSLQIILGLLGAVSGGAWLAPAESAAMLIPLIQQELAVFFLVGTVVSVGSDAGWIMNEVAKLPYQPRSYEEKIKLCRLRALTVSIMVVFSLLSTTAATYAIFKYNLGAEKIWAAVICPVYFSYGLYGYSRFIDSVRKFSRNKLGKNKEMAQLKQVFVSKLYSMSRDRKFLQSFNFSSVGSFLTYIDQQSQETARKQSLLRRVLQLVLAILLPAFASLVAILLAIKAYEIMWDQPVFYYSMTVIGEVPSYVLGVVSTYGLFDTLGHILAGFFRKNNQAAPIIRQIFKHQLGALLVPTFLMSLAAPSPGAYITYNELGNFTFFANTSFTPAQMEENQMAQRYIQLIGTVAVAFSRVILAAFTMTRLQEGAFGLYQKYSCKTKFSDDTKALKLSDAIADIAFKLDSSHSEQSMTAINCIRSEMGVN